MTNPDLAELVNLLMPYAMECLSESRPFKPMAASINLAGEMTPHVSTFIRTRTQTMDSRLSRHLFELAATRQIRALCICREIALSSNSPCGTSVISCEFEDINGNAFNFQLPFQRDVGTSTVVFGNLIGKTKLPMYYPSRRNNEKPAFQGKRRIKLRVPGMVESRLHSKR